VINEQQAVKQRPYGANFATRRHLQTM